MCRAGVGSRTETLEKDPTASELPIFQTKERNNRDERHHERDSDKPHMQLAHREALEPNDLNLFTELLDGAVDELLHGK